MPSWLAHASDEQKARFREAISQGQRRAWQNGRKGNYQHPRGREAALYAQGLPEACARFYWLARYVLGYHNSHWDAAKIIATIQWFTKRGQKAGDDVYVKWGKWLLGTHRIGQWDRMKPEYRHRLPEIEAEYQKWMVKLGG
jgi:hypothetical protein